MLTSIPDEETSDPRQRFAADLGRDTARHRPAREVDPRMVVVTLLGAAVNLRPAVTSLGPVLEEARRGLSMNSAVAGLLASFPMLCFAVFGVTAPRLEHRFGPGAVVLAGMCALTAGLLLRPLAGSRTFLIGVANRSFHRSRATSGTPAHTRD